MANIDTTDTFHEEVKLNNLQKWIMTIIMSKLELQQQQQKNSKNKII